MRARAAAVALAWISGGCGAASELPADVGQCPIPTDQGCAQPRGLYETSYVERVGGTCGPMATVRAEAALHRVYGFGEPCSGFVDWSDDFGLASFEASCPEEETGSGFYNEQVSHTSYSRDGLSRSGVFEERIFEADGTLFCSSIYDLETRSLSCD